MYLRKRWVVIVLAAATVALMAACSGDSSESEVGRDAGTSGTPNAPTATTNSTATAGPTSTANPVATANPNATHTSPTATTVAPPAFRSPVSLPTRELEFRVRVPDNHPAGERVTLMTMPPGNVISLDRIELKHDPAEPGVYTGTATVEMGALLRYTYDRWDGQSVAGWDAFRETVEDVYQFVNRYVLVTDEVDVIEDTVALWRDLPGPQHNGTITGTVVDQATGGPVIDATVSISGVHTATDWRGNFTVNNLPDGEHRAVVLTTLGDYRAQQYEFDIEDGAATEDVRVFLESARKVPVTFDVGLPDVTPPDAEIAISGNLWQLGARSGGYPFQPDAMALPALDRHGSSRATLTVDLYEGTYVNYTYTIRSISEGADQSDSGAVFRSFIVDESSRTRSDTVERWHNGEWPITALRVTVPSNTTPGVPVGISTGPTAWMARSGPNEWVAHIIHNPPGSEFEFGLRLGDDNGGGDGSVGTIESRRTVTIPENGDEIAIAVTKWKQLPDPTPRQSNGGLAVTFRVSVPLETPENAVVRLTGDRAAMSGGIEMQKRPDNPWLYEATVEFDHDGGLNYDYEIDGVGASTRSYDVFTEFDGQLVSDWVGEWDGLTPTGVDARPEWRSGLYLPDYWSTSFADTSESAFERIDSVANGEWVALSSVWSFGRFQPTPTIEQRPVQIWTVQTPLENIKAQAAQAHAAGLNVFLAPQQNPEVIPGWNDPPLNLWDQEWWEAWLIEAERQWMWNAIVAEEIGAEMLMLPGPIFHVFPNAGQSDDDPFQQEFDGAIARLVEQVRGVYGGLVMMSGNNANYDFPGLADLRGVTTYDLGVPSLPDDATVAEWKDAYRTNFEERVDPIRERWVGPVMFYTIHAPGTGSGQFGASAPTGDPFGEHVQANRLEAIYQLIAERPWIEGAFSWAYDYVDTPAGLNDGVRGRLGEAVQAKWYDRLSGGK
ncbi:MAG: carboxypeptidase regulatory-like domain-containing protein [Chloroflexi bacterium]|nr:carboxypeptidase regulatory-like domain-containing protein [Chloroflexota bacterium]